jgi:uncharacterized protein (DUF1697 family)
MARQIALLRGINVGRTTKVGMAPLRELFAELGHTDIKTYINSGNVVFDGPKVAVGKVEAALAERFGFAIPVVVRTRDEIAAVVAADPLGDVASNASRYMVVFSGGGPIDASRAEGVQTGAGESYKILGAEGYLWLPDGVQSSPLARTFNEKRFGVTLTSRNWRTCEKLLALADA